MSKLRTLSGVIAVGLIAAALPLQAPAAQDAHQACTSQCSRQADACDKSAESVPIEERAPALKPCTDHFIACMQACKSVGAGSAPTQHGAGGGAPPKPEVSNACLEIGPPQISSSCGRGRFWYFTRIRRRAVAGCPRDVYFTYVDPEDGKRQPDAVTPYTVQTCGGPPQDVEAAR